MSIAFGETNVQTDIAFTIAGRYPGQLINPLAANFSGAVQGFVTEELILVGRGVVQGTLTTLNDTDPQNRGKPYLIKNPLIGSVEADFVGITTRNQGEDTEDFSISGDPAAKAAKRPASILVIGYGHQIGAQTAVAVVAGDPVFMAVNPVNAANIGVGEFAKAAGAGLIALTDLTWYMPAQANTVGVIIMNGEPRIV